MAPVKPYFCKRNLGTDCLLTNFDYYANRLVVNDENFLFKTRKVLLMSSESSTDYVLEHNSESISRVLEG